MKEALSQRNLNFAYVDITSGMLHLKNFLKVRDHNDSHKEARENGRVGIPALSVDGVSYVVAGADDALKLAEELGLF